MSKYNFNYKYRIYPTTRQVHILEAYSDISKRYWNLINNLMLDSTYPYWQIIKDTCTDDEFAGEKLITIQRYTKYLRNNSEYWGQLSKSSFEKISDRYKLAYQKFWKMRTKERPFKGVPKFKKDSEFMSISFRKRTSTDKVVFNIKGKTARFNPAPRSDIGDIKIKYHRPLPDCYTMDYLVIDKDLTGAWYVVFTCTSEKPRKHYPTPPNYAIGIDLGMYSLLALSDGTLIDNPRWYKSQLRKTKVLNRKFSRRGKWSKADAKGRRRLTLKTTRHNQTRDEVARWHKRIAERRKYDYNLITDWLTRQYQVIVLEDIDWKFMRENKRIAISIQDASFGIFKQLLEAKAKERGNQIVYVKPHGTSQECSQCGQVVKKSLSTRIHRCECGCELDRDINASINILNRGLLFIKSGL